MKLVQKYFYQLILSTALLAGAVFSPVMAGVPFPQVSAPAEAQPYFLVANPDGSKTERITIYEAGDGNCYVFLPSYAKFDRITVAEGKGHRFTLGDVELSDGLNCGSFQLDTPYAFASDGEHMADLWFFRSENMAAMYIDTVSGTLDGILHDTFPEELASARLYTADGNLDLFDEYTTLKCRGYSSWDVDKKSYTLSLGQNTGLLRMGASEKWTLTANAFDETRLRNKIVYSFADAVSPHSAWSPDCAYTELYLNGEYVGLYLLCQKPGAGPDHFNLPPEDYYFETAPVTRRLNGPAVFEVCSSQSAEIVFPKNCDETQRDFLQSRVKAIHAALLSEEGTQWQEYIDLDSWARKYLIEEVFSNTDGGRSSQYFWFDTSEGKLLAGHCWDYDNTLGRSGKGAWSFPYSMLAQRDWTYDTSWFGALCQKEEFMDAVEKLYETEFRPLLLEYAEKTIPALAEDIRYAIPSEYLRWPDLHTQTGWSAATESVITHLQERIAFLDELWLEKLEFYKISAEDSNLYVRANTVCEDLPRPAGSAEGIWYLEGTDIPFDATQPVTCDIWLSAVPTVELPPETTPPETEAPPVAVPSEKEETAAAEAADTNTNTIRNYITFIAKTVSNLTKLEFITMLSVMALALLLVCFVCVDIHLRRKDRRNADAPSRTNIPS